MTKNQQNRQVGDFIPKVYIYHCYGGSHSSVTAAAVHVGLLDPGSLPTKQVLLSLPYFDTQKSDDHGVLQYLGEDEEGNLVFSVGLETSAKQIIAALSNLLAITKAQGPRLIFVPTMPAVNRWMKLGGVCSRVLGLKGIGRPLLAYGTRQAYPEIVKLAHRAKDMGDG